MSQRFSFVQIFESIKNSKLPIVSVGSGMGLDEELMIKKYKCNIILVDPTKDNEDKYRDVKMARRPDFKNVKELMKAKPELKGNCVVMLLYPLPDFAMYDIFSIYDLSPKEVVIMYNPFGASGSFLLHNFLRNINATELSAAKLEMVSTLPNFPVISSDSYVLRNVKYNYPEKKETVCKAHESIPIYKKLKEKNHDLMMLVSLEKVRDFDNSRPSPKLRDEMVCDGTSPMEKLCEMMCTMNEFF